MRLWTDFNDIEENGQVWADLDYAQFFFEHELRAGNTSELTDGAGHECIGTIVRVDLDRRMVWLEIDWDTWRFSERSRIRQGFKSAAGGYGAGFVRGRELVA
jgi:hypothetical protein